MVRAVACYVLSLIGLLFLWGLVLAPLWHYVPDRKNG